MKVFQSHKKEFVNALVYLILLGGVVLGGIFLYRYILISSSIRSDRKVLMYNDYVIDYVSAKDSSICVEPLEGSEIIFKKNTFIIRSECLRIEGKYKLKDYNRIEILQCDSLKSWFRGESIFLIYNGGFSMENDYLIIYASVE